ncbi:MAG: DUF308 domain-containing protein [Erysipelotrichaceae bacterium]|nr:DUF308 domain-containing protein [Erysipelotrichaceae bacterium]MBQ7889041.1 DUF308 domain-containing protein [Erysipelotrichaceae bacterium]
MIEKKKMFDIIVMIVVELVVGLMLLVNPIELTSVILICIGTVLLVEGVRQVIHYFMDEPDQASKQNTAAKGILLILLGILCVFKTDWFIRTFPVLTMLYGVILVISGVEKIQRTLDAIRLKSKKWGLIGLNALISIVCALLILFYPFESTQFLWMLTGCAFLGEALLDIASLINMHTKKKQ